jgi:hypothetical protein
MERQLSARSISMSPEQRDQQQRIMTANTRNSIQVVSKMFEMRKSISLAKTDNKLSEPTERENVAPPTLNQKPSVMLSMMNSLKPRNFTANRRQRLPKLPANMETTSTIF